MKAKLSLMALLMMGSLASAAEYVLWDSTIDPEETHTAAYSFEYYYPKDNKARMVADTANGVITLTASNLVKDKDSKNSVGVGYGIIYSQTDDYEDDVMSLAKYTGLCIAYSAEQKFRLDFKQSNISDDNFHGVTMAASSAKKTQFIAFDSLSQGWTSDLKISFNKAKQQGLQFGFKDAHLKSGVTGNVIKIYKMVFGDECESFPTTVLAPYDEDGAETLPEGEVLTYTLSKMFSDADGDASVTVEILKGDEFVKIEGAAESYTLDDVVKISAQPNVNGEAIVVFTAKDPTHTAVTYATSITVENQEQPPMAVNDSYTVKEDETLTVEFDEGILANDYDPDDKKGTNPAQAFEILSNTKPAHGTLALGDDGSFIYEPDPDFNGTDTWTYTLVSKADEDLVSKAGTVTIKVTPVNDKPTVTVVNTEVFDEVRTVDEDFEKSFNILLPIEDVVFSDPDGDETLTMGAATNGLVKATYGGVVAGYYKITIESVPNANGDALVALYATDKTDTAAVIFAITVNPVADPPLALDDTIVAYEDSLLTVKAAKGVLANDVNPDDATVPLKAVLDKTTEHGELTFEEDGSFTYMPEADFSGEDSFTYFAITDDDDETESNVATVVIQVTDMNDPPVVTLDTNVIDTVLAEDFSKSLVFGAATVKKWFSDPDGDTLAFTVKSEDGKLAPTYATTGLQIKSVKDSVGDAYVTLTADDLKSGTASITIHVLLTPTNDKPVLVKNDTLYVKELKNWSVSVELNDYVYDVDGDTLKFTPQIPAALAKKVQVEVDGSKLTVSGYKDVTYVSGEMIAFGVRASDSLSHVTVSFYVVIGSDKPSTGLFPTIASPKATWQNAIMANRGMVSITDMQGRVMWKAKLPVSEADVRNASAQVQGRKLLRVNGNTWTIK